MRVNLAWIVLLLGACSNGYDPVSVPPPPPPAPSQTFRLEISPSGGNAISLFLGSTIQLAPRLVSSAGDTVATSGSVSFTSRTPTTVSVDASGRVAALTTGTSTVAASTIHNGQAETDSLAVSVFCTLELAVLVTPVNPVLLIGEGFTPSVSLKSCGGQLTLTDTFVWSTLEPAIVTVHPSTGATVGLKAGTARVQVRGQSYGMLAEIFVTVR